MDTSPIAWLLSYSKTDGRHHRDSPSEEPAAFWKINGYRARLLVWTQDEWEKLQTPPSDAQFHPTGVWCALRMD